jgi:antitoxin (DNA-binding transcriptional repressor) of toxin-antitoxin stability system
VPTGEIGASEAYNLTQYDFTHISVKTITATELARNLSDVLDTLARDGSEVLIERNRKQVARLVPAPGRQNALEALADLYRTLPERAAEGWAEGTHGVLAGETLEVSGDPWAS